MLFRTKGDVFALIDQERARFGVTRLCRCYGVTRAGYYAWRQRPASRHQEQDRVLWTAIMAIFTASRGTYGSPRVHRALRQRGQRVSRRRVEWLMRGGGLRGRVARVYRRKAGTHRWFGQHPNHVRWTRATGPNHIWVGRAARLHHDVCRGVGGEESFALRSGEPLPSDHPPGRIGERELKHRLCQVHTDRRSIHVGLLLVPLTGISDAAEFCRGNREESIPSFAAVGDGVTVSRRG